MEDKDKEIVLFAVKKSANPGKPTTAKDVE